MTLVKELKRRNVFRVAVAYVVVGWVVLQVADTFAPILGLPEWTTRLLLFLGFAGLPFAIIFAWAFELTPEGIKRTEDVQTGQSITPQTGSKLNRLIIALLSVALVLILLERFVFQIDNNNMEEPTIVVPVEEGINSIAVLPFVNMSDDRANEHFGDGLAEELLNLLAKVPELHVAARTSSFYFKDKDVKIREVAEALNVESVLEGSVRRSGDTIRVVAQLINAADGAHLWSEKYDRPLNDVFKVQDDISRQIVSALMPHLDVDDVIQTSNTANTIAPEIYARFLLAKQLYYEATDEAILAANSEFNAVTRLAPTFAEGWAWLAQSWYFMPDMDDADRFPKADSAIEVALQLAPGEPLARSVQAGLLASSGDHQGAVDLLDEVIIDHPGFADAVLAKMFPLLSLGRPDEAIAALEAARRLDPLHPVMLRNLAHLLNLQGETAEAFDVVDQLYQVSAGMAIEMDMHIYGDNEAIPQLIYFWEQMQGTDKEQYLDRDYGAWWMLEMGLHDHPALKGTALEPVALVYTQGKEAAEQAMALKLVDTPQKRNRVEMEAELRIALGEYVEASDALWAYWQSLDQEGFNDNFWERHAEYLVATSIKAGFEERVTVMLPLLQQSSLGGSKLHNGNYLLNLAAMAIFEGRDEDAIAIYHQLADLGAPGNYIYNSPFRLAFLVQDDARYDEVRERFQANHAEKLEELDHLRGSGISLDEMRADYLAGLAKRR
ncbi:MAG: hypothetical protein ABJ084_10735 [Halioglobus sp.]